jgi:hypothetical protein
MKKNAVIRITKKMKYKNEANFTASISLNNTWIMANDTAVFRKYRNSKPKNNWIFSIFGMGKL